MKTVLFGLDGATYTVLDHLMAAGVMPHLASLASQGVRANLESTALPLTPLAWTTLATGRSPGHHGITDWIRCQRRGEGTFIHLFDSRDNHCPTLWRRVSDAGLRVTALNYFGLAPPEPINGHTMPGFTSGRHLRRSSHPSDLFARLSAVDGFDVKVLGMDFDVETQGLQEMDREAWFPWIDHQIERDRVWLEVLTHLMREEPSDLTAIVLDGVDKLQHLAYRYLDPAHLPTEPDEWEQRVVARCHDYFRMVDEYLGRALEIVGPWGRLFVVSDHGFTASQEIFYVNRWLHDQGWLTWRGDVPEDDAEACQTDRPAADANLVDLEASRAYALTPSSNGIWIDVAADEFESFRAELESGLRNVVAADGQPVVTDIKRREETFPGAFSEQFPHLTLTLRDHSFISVLNGRAAVAPRSAPVGTHHPVGILLGRGVGLRTGTAEDSYNLLDIAPLALHSLGLPIPAELEGEFPAALYDPQYVASDPPRIATESPAAEPSEAAVDDEEAQFDAEDEAIILARLKSLGYIE